MIGLITYQAINLIFQELGAVKKMREEIIPGTKSVIKLAGESYIYNYKMPL